MRSTMTMQAIAERRPGRRWQRLFRVSWPAYRRWYLRDGGDRRPALAHAGRALAEHMPELLETWYRLVALSGHDQLAARMLTLYDPPCHVVGCSQAVFCAPGGAPLLARNYDYSPKLFERVVYSSQFAERRVTGTGDCLWGLLDGLNDAGLAVSLTFGGRPVRAPGFGIQLVVRYLLETCETVTDAHLALGRVPVQCSSNLTLLDRGGAAATVWVGPDHAPVITSAPAATNHQASIEWPEYARWTRTVERRARLEQLLLDPATGEESFVSAFLHPPLRTGDYANGFGTLYTAVLRPSTGTVEYRWPGSIWRHRLERPRSGTHTASLA